jgi:protein-disulfide isomerase
MKRLLPFTIIILVLAFSVGAYWFMTRPVQTIGGGRGSSLAAGPGTAGADSAAVVNASPGAAPAHFRGPESAPAMLEEFGDFECPPCGGVYPILKQMESEFGSRLRVTFREFPLTPPHVHALAAARAAEASGLQGKFFEMHDMLYENQTTWKDAFDVRPIFEGYASKIGLDVERFKSDNASDAVERRITLDGSRGHSLGVKGTPTVFLNGVEIPFEQLTTAETLRAAINKGLSAPAK